jgi:MraZ protein
MFRGISAISLDAKGRMAIPTQYRDVILEEAEGAMVVTIDTQDRCLMLYTYPQWQDIEEQLSSLPTFNPVTRRIQRLLIGHANDLNLDKSGRVLLPPILRDYAGLEKNIILVGQGKRFEIWGESQWELGRDSWLAEDISDDGGVPSELLSLSL